jgi:hypothetical protein
MKERPILFNADMVRAIFDGRKTQTRRVVKGNFDYIVKGWPFTRQVMKLGAGDKLEVIQDDGKSIATFGLRCPYGQVGDRLWVRETFYPYDDGMDSGGCSHVFYKADGEPPFNDIKWKPSIYMPREFSRIILEVTDVRVERLNNISEEDAMAEGVSTTDYFFGTHLYRNKKHVSYVDYLNEAVGCRTAKVSFDTLWESINGKGSWKANSWVWVVEFKVLEVRG